MEHGRNRKDYQVMIDEKKLLADLEDEIRLIPPIEENRDMFYFYSGWNTVVVGLRCLVNNQPKLSLETKTSDKWIPCSKELPPKPECGLWKAYIVQQENVFYPYVAYFTDDGWRDDDLDEIRNIIAWMPLPDAYITNGGSE